ncbi:MAG: HIT family protein [Bacteroidota bacterium]
MASIFSKIIAGEIPSYQVAETANFIAFLDISPRTAGHTLVVPKQEVDYIFDLDAATYAALWTFARQVAAAVEKAVPCERVGVAVIGLEVPHTHIHLIPINSVGDVNFSRPAATLTKQEYEEIAQEISQAFQATNE